MPTEIFSARTIDFSDPADVARHDSLDALVVQMLSLHKQLPETSTPHEKTALERQIEATDGQIDGGPAVRSDGGGDRNCGGKSDFMKTRQARYIKMKACK